MLVPLSISQGAQFRPPTEPHLRAVGGICVRCAGCRCSCESRSRRLKAVGGAVGSAVWQVQQCRHLRARYEPYVCSEEQV